MCLESKTDEVLKSTESMRTGIQTMVVSLSIEERVSFLRLSRQHEPFEFSAAGYY